VPFYDSLRSGGLLLGWINLQAPNTNGTGLVWIHPATSRGLYTNGFANTVPVQISQWTNPPPDFSSLTNLVIEGAVGDPANLYLFDLPVTVINNKLGESAGSVNVTGSLNPKTGLLKTSFNNGLGRTNGFGVILQNASYGGGYFLTPTNSEAFELRH